MNTQVLRMELVKEYNQTRLHHHHSRLSTAKLKQTRYRWEREDENS